MVIPIIIPMNERPIWRVLKPCPVGEGEPKTRVKAPLKRNERP